MSKFQIIFIGFFIATLVNSSALPAFAEEMGPEGEPFKNPSTFGKFEVGLPGIAEDATIDDFVQDPKPILKFINLAVNAVIAILVIIGLITIVIGGYTYMTASGDASKVKLAKEMIIAALAGIFLSLVSVIILNTINTYLGSGAEEPKFDEPSGGSGGGSGGGGSGGGSGGGGGGSSTLTQLQSRKTEYENTIAQMNEQLRRPNNTDAQIKEYWDTKLDRQARLDAVNREIANLNK